MGKLDGKTIAFVAADGVEQVELTQPWEAVKDEGAEAELLSIEDGQIQGFEHLDHGKKFDVDKKVADADPNDYDGLVLPGGVANPDFLRADDDVRKFVRSFFEAGKPVGAICHGPWTLIDAGVVEGLTTSRKPDDLPAFCDKIVEELCEGKHEELAQATASS